MSKSPSPNRAEFLLKIQHHLESVARVAETRPDLFSKVVSDTELEKIQEIVSCLVTEIEKEKKQEGGV